MANFLTPSSQLMCPHGGMVTAIGQNAQAKAGGDFVVRSSDQFMVAGCPIIIAGAPHPCMQIQWLQPSSSTKAAQDFTLTEASSGLCVAGDQVPQGAPQVTTTQPQAAGQ
jgi:uncharacterized Zn-binding protein involved in type VI secretion